MPTSETDLRNHQKIAHDVVDNHHEEEEEEERMAEAADSPPRGHQQSSEAVPAIPSLVQSKVSLLHKKSCCERCGATIGTVKVQSRDTCLGSG